MQRIIIKYLAFTLVLGVAIGTKVGPYLERLKKTAAPAIETAKTVSSNEVIPESVNLGVAWGDLIVKMVKNGAIDKNKFLKLYEDRQADMTQVKLLLENPSGEDIVVTAQNSQLILNLLWPLGIANKTNVLSQGPIGTQYKGQEGNFASTGGWTLGSRDGGKLFNSLSLLPLTREQEKKVTEISQNIYRPCCGNSTYFPDCNHGAAMLGYIEMAVKAGLPKEQIYKNALALNSYWFPQTYTEIATLMKAKNNVEWKDVKPEVALGVEYSSGQGSRKVNQELQTLGLVPKVSGGGGCGV